MKIALLLILIIGLHLSAYAQLENGRGISAREANDTIGIAQVKGWQLKNALLSLGVSAGVHIGFSSLSMDDVNSDLQRFGSELRGFGLKPDSPETIDGGVIFGGSVLLRLNRFLLGMSLGSISSVGNFSFRDQTGSLAVNFDVRSLEAVPLIGLRVPMGDLFCLDLMAGVGYGKADATYNVTFRNNANASNNLDLVQNVSGSYLAKRLEGSFKILFERVSFHATVGSRFSNAGVIKGKQTLNGQTTQGEYAVLGENDKEIEFNFSGLMVRAGMAIEF